MKAVGMSRSRRHGITGLACVALLALAACGGEAPPAATPAASAAPPPPPPASAMAAAPAPSASAAPSAAPAPAPVPGATGEVEDAGEHRHHHGGGVTMLIAMSLRDLQLTDDQKAKVEKARTEIMDKMKPVHAADKDFAGVLADGVAAGKVDKAKADAAIDKIVAQSQKLHDASADALVQLHDALTAAQRVELIDKIQAQFEKWKAAHGKDEADDKEHHSGNLLALVRDLNLPQDEAQKIKAAFQEKMKAGGKDKNAKEAGDHEHKDVTDHIAAFGTAFKADKFDAKKVSSAKADQHMVRFAASRRAAFLEVAAPILTADQRTKLADEIRKHHEEAPKP
jgi:Spy/CpxP family protein refolding chaperone